MIVEETGLSGLLLIKPKVFGDARGYFIETYRRQRYAEYGISAEFVQDNHSHSAKFVLRGLHYQLRHPQGKLVSVVSGAVFDVAVDIRRGSESFGRWYGVELNEDNHYQMYIPPGFAHGFVTLTDDVDFLYKCTDVYHPEDEYGVIWNDPKLNIQWPCDAPSLSQKDAQYPELDSIDPVFLPGVE